MVVQAIKHDRQFFISMAIRRNINAITKFDIADLTFAS